MMKKLIAAALCAVCLTPLPAMAGSPDGKLQVKVLGTAVLPDGKVDSVKYDPLNLTVGADTKLNDNVAPTLAIEYFVTPNISAETICCFTSHHVTGTGALAGAGLVDHVMVLPATLTLKYHFGQPGGIQPYIGAGPSIFFYIDERPGATASALGVTKVKMSNNFGAAVQAGIDVPVNNQGLGVTLDAKKYFMKTTAHFYAGSAEVLTTKHKVDPWVLSAGVSYRF